MKPVAILRFAPQDGPAFFSSWLDRRGIAQELVRIDAQDAVPGDPRAFSGVAIMGGPMSANDDLPWIAPVLDFIRGCAAADVPMIGHCLGGQLMSKALGGTVLRNPVKELGWGLVRIEPTPIARDWFGGIDAFQSFHWHGDTFTIPPRAQRLASSDYCANQAFALGPHLGLQCHVEILPDVVRAWAGAGGDEIAGAHALGQQASVQTPAQMEAGIPLHGARLSAVATGLYDRWASALAR
jgi:GMP synthase-like glutamine amidotransferase